MRTNDVSFAAHIFKELANKEHTLIRCHCAKHILCMISVIPEIIWVSTVTLHLTDDSAATERLSDLITPEK